MKDYDISCRQLLVTLVERAGFLVEEDVNNMMTDMSKEVGKIRECVIRRWQEL